MVLADDSVLYRSEVNVPSNGADRAKLQNWIPLDIRPSIVIQVTDNRSLKAFRTHIRVLLERAGSVGVRDGFN